MKKVLIIGCNGFIGRQLCNELIKKNIVVIGIDISNEANSDIKDSLIYLNLNDFYKTMETDSPVLPNLLNADVAYHLAWCGVSTTDKNNYQKQFSNFEITYKVLLCLRNIKVKKVIIPGSVSEYSHCLNKVTGYEIPSPSDLYAATKVSIHTIARQFCDANDIDLNWLLITSVYGPSRNDNNLLTYTIRSLLCNKNVECTKLEQDWDYIYIDDLISALYLIGEKGEKNVIYPIGSGENHKLSYYVFMIANLLKKDNLLFVGALPYKNKYIDNSIVDISALRKIGFKPNTSFKDGIKRVIDQFSNVK